uniref:Uncharacterized protein n=1 Tax=Rhizophora mucronata TaxID=61149 RepID=A0A2P2NJE7_RHIMU
MISPYLSLKIKLIACIF